MRGFDRSLACAWVSAVHRSAVVVGAGIVVLSAAPQAHANAGAEVVITWSGDRQSAKHYLAVVVELLARLPVALRIAEAPTFREGDVLSAPRESEGPAARVWVSLDERAHVYVLDPRRHTIMVRHFPRDPGDENAKEAVGQVVQSAVSVLLAGDSRHDATSPVGGADAELASPPLVLPNPESPLAPLASSWARSQSTDGQVARREGATLLGASVGNRWYGGRSAAEMAVDLYRRVRTGNAPIFAGAGAVYRSPIVLDTERIGATLRAAEVRAVLLFSTDVLASWALEGSLTLGAIMERLSPEVQGGAVAGAATAHAVPARWYVNPAVGVSAGVAVQLGLVRAHLRGDVDTTLGRPQYDVRVGTEPRTVFEPWLFRPGMSVALTCCWTR